ncbi:MAG: deoxyribose-phosphate aldolase [Oscillospiraceae bacterium]|jgi:deoxyribose-phosphate aldolase|nr:deoxyribose-phosphate aldolase [Oscillospiraceae bacterium]
MQYPLQHFDAKATAPASLAQYIDHTLLAANATEAAVLALCDEARAHGFASVCVNPRFVRAAAERLQGATTAVCTVIGFPLGANDSQTKAFETRLAIEQGALEVDMVIPIGAAKAGDWDYVESDIRAVVEAAKGRALVKVIIETCLLTDDEKRKACQIAQKAGADYVKTSTGFSTGGATAEDIALMKQTVGEGTGVKASGGVRSFADAIAMLNAGASRLGTSAGVKIVKEAEHV